MKITKRQLRRIIKEERARLNELGIDRMTSGDRDPRLDDPDDLTLSIETWEKVVTHLQALDDIFASEAGRHIGQGSFGDRGVVEKIREALPWSQEWLQYMKEED